MEQSFYPTVKKIGDSKSTGKKLPVWYSSRAEGGELGWSQPVDYPGQLPWSS